MLLLHYKRYEGRLFQHMDFFNWPEGSLRDWFLDEKGVIMVRRAGMVLRLYMSYMDSGQWPGLEV